MIRLERQDLTAAAADLQEAIRLNDHRFEAFSALGQVYQRQGRTDDALKQFARAIQLRPNWAPLYRGRADVLLGLKNLSPDQRDAAFSDLEDRDPLRVSRAIPLIAADRTKQAALLHQAGRHDEALDACDAALEIAPRYAPAHLLRIQGTPRPEALRRPDPVVRRRPRIGQAIGRALRAARDGERRPGGLPGRDRRLYPVAVAVVQAEKPRLLRRRGWSYLANDAFRPAVHDFDEAIRLAPTNADAYSGRGLARARLGQHRDAVSDAEEALKHGDSQLENRLQRRPDLRASRHCR